MFVITKGLDLNISKASETCETQSRVKVVYKELSVHLADWAQTLLLLLLLFTIGFCIAQEENNFQCWKFRIRALNKKATKLEVI